MNEIWFLRAETAAIKARTFVLRIEIVILKIRALPWKAMSRMLDSQNRYVEGFAMGIARVGLLVWLFFFRLKWKLTFDLWYPARWRLAMLSRWLRGE